MNGGDAERRKQCNAAENTDGKRRKIKGEKRRVKKGQIGKMLRVERVSSIAYRKSMFARMLSQWMRVCLIS